MVVWHDLTRFDTFWYFLTPVFGRAPARVKNERPELYLFFTVSLPFYDFSPVQFSKNLGQLQGRPGTEMPFRRGRARR
jgi:hypothetical protein